MPYRLLVLLVALNPGLALAIPEAALEHEELAVSGVYAGVGYGLHRYFDGAFSAAQDSDSGQAFDGTYVQMNAGYLARWGGLLAFDWAHYSASNQVRTTNGELRLGLTTDAFGAMAGLQVGGRVRFQFAALAGLALGRFDRTFRAGLFVDHATSRLEHLNLGGEAGLCVLATEWLSIGARLRSTFTFGTGDEADLGGLFLGLNASVTL